jgi:hypothetical protein
MRIAIIAYFGILGLVAYLTAAVPKDPNFQTVTTDVLKNINGTYVNAWQIKKNYLTMTPTMTVTPGKAISTATPTPVGL